VYKYLEERRADNAKKIVAHTTYRFICPRRKGGGVRKNLEFHGRSSRGKKGEEEGGKKPGDGGGKKKGGREKKMQIS